MDSFIGRVWDLLDESLYIYGRELFFMFDRVWVLGFQLILDNLLDLLLGFLEFFVMFKI